MSNVIRRGPNPVQHVADFTAQLSGIPGGPLAYITEVEIDFGPIPRSDGFFVVLDPRVKLGAHILAEVAYKAPTGKDLDEIEMDDLEIRAGAPSDGVMNLFIHAADGSYLHDKFRVNYELGR